MHKTAEAEDLMVRGDALFRAIYEKAAVGIALVDYNGRPIAINPALQKILGYTEEEIKSMVFTEFTHPEDASKDWALFQELIEGKRDQYQMEKRYFHKNGQIVHGLLNVSLIKGLRADAPFVIATVVDITERKQVEEELTILNKLMQAVHRFLDLEEVYDVALDTVVSMENVDMVMIYIVDEEKKEAVLQAHRNTPEFYIQGASRIPYPNGITWKVINSRTIVNLEDVQKDPDIGPTGRTIGHHSVLGIPIFLENKVIGVLWFAGYKERKFCENEVQFLTTLGDQIAIAVAKAKMLKEIKRTQDQLIQSEKLASIGQLISSIAHEINNPLTPIIGYSQRLLEKNGLDQKEKESLEIIHNSAQRVFRIIEKLLTFSRKHAPLRTYEEINDLVVHSLEFREYQLKLENIRIIKKLDPNLPKMMVDANQIQQVFMNILLNAEQAIVDYHGRGTIQVKTMVSNNRFIEIHISDDGPGIPEEIRGKVFDPFFTTKEPGKGTGLGLSVSYGIIKEHGGDIRMLDNEGGGITFVVDLPILTESASAIADEKQMILRAFNRNKVLVVEDEVMVVGLLKSVLEETGNIVDIAFNGKEAINRIDLNLYDLIICDIRMPEINGVKFYDEVQRIKPGLAGKIVFITGDPSNETKDFLDKVGNPYIVKPFKIEKLKAQLNQILLGIQTPAAG